MSGYATGSVALSAEQYTSWFAGVDRCLKEVWIIISTCESGFAHRHLATAVREETSSHANFLLAAHIGFGELIQFIDFIRAEHYVMDANSHICQAQGWN
jgi:hypothetical protein